MKRKERARVLSRELLAQDIWSLRLSVSFAGEVKAGQFVSLFSNDGSRLLPRPISICEADGRDGWIRLVFRVAGEGTREFSRLEAGDSLSVLGPLGNGFPISETEGKRVLLVGGGIGIPPMLACAKALVQCGASSVLAAVGYRTADTYLLEDLKRYAPVLISTDDGSLGVHGTVLDAIEASGEKADVIFACGPKVMLRAVKEYAARTGAEAYVSMEERMACGVGVCLGCVTDTTGIDPHSGVKRARVCADGPVFPAGEVDLS